MKRTIALLMAIAMLFALAACGSSGAAEPAGSTAAEEAAAPDQAKSDSSNEPLDAEIVESGYKVDGGYLYYSVTLHNPNTDYAIETPSYRVTAKDESGAVLGTMEHTLSVIYPGQDFSYAFQGFSCDGEPAEVSFDIIPAEDYNFTKVSALEHDTFVPLEIVGANMTSDGFTSSVLGEVKNNNDYDIDSAVVVVFFRDADGNLEGGMSTFINNVPAGGTAAFDVDIYSDIITDNFEVYANSWL